MEKLLAELEILRNSGAAIIVEGKKDKIALEKAGIKNIITLNMPLYKVVEEVQDKEVAILTDLDSEGKKLYSSLAHYLSQNGERINNRFRNFLFKETKLRQIEGLTKYLQT